MKRTSEAYLLRQESPTRAWRSTIRNGNGVSFRWYPMARPACPPPMIRTSSSGAFSVMQPPS